MLQHNTHTPIAQICPNIICLCIVYVTRRNVNWLKCVYTHFQMGLKLYTIYRRIVLNLICYKLCFVSFHFDFYGTSINSKQPVEAFHYG